MQRHCAKYSTRGFHLCKLGGTILRWQNKLTSMFIPFIVMGSKYSHRDHCHKELHNSFAHWERYTITKKILRHKSHQAAQYYRLKVLWRAFRTWQKHARINAGLVWYLSVFYTWKFIYDVTGWGTRCSRRENTKSYSCGVPGHGWRKSIIRMRR